MLENNVRIIKYKVGLLNLAEELGMFPGLARPWAYRGTRFTATKRQWSGGIAIYGGSAEDRG